MLAGLRTLVIAVAISTVIGAILGVFAGALVRGTTYELFGFDIPKFVLIVAVMAFVGSNIGFAFAYGFLPEEPAE